MASAIRDYSRHITRDIEAFKAKFPHPMNRLIITLALMGWALSAYSTLSSQSSRAEAQAEISRLLQIVEKTSAQNSELAGRLEELSHNNQDLQHLQKQIAAATQELKHLEYLRARVSGEIDAIRPQPAAPVDHRSMGGTNTDVDVTPSPLPRALSLKEAPAPSAAANNLPSQEEVREAQQALTMLGYGQLKPDGVFGPSTRRSIEAFEQAQGLPVTGRLEAATLQAIRARRSAALQ